MTVTLSMLFGGVLASQMTSHSNTPILLKISPPVSARSSGDKRANRSAVRGPSKGGGRAASFCQREDLRLRDAEACQFRRSVLRPRFCGRRVRDRARRSRPCPPAFPLGLEIVRLPRIDFERERQGMRKNVGPPMTLANMRSNGVRVVIAKCEACGHEADVNVDALPEATAVPEAGRRLRCGQCGGKRIIRGPPGIPANVVIQNQLVKEPRKAVVS